MVKLTNRTRAHPKIKRLLYQVFSRYQSKTLHYDRLANL